MAEHIFLQSIGRTLLLRGQYTEKRIVVQPLPVDLNNMYFFVYLKIVCLQICKIKLPLCIIKHHINLRVGKELLVHIGYEAGWTEYIVLSKL